MKITGEKLNKVIDLYFKDLEKDLLKIVPKTENK